MNIEDNVTVMVNIASSVPILNTANNATIALIDVLVNVLVVGLNLIVLNRIVFSRIVLDRIVLY